jgi:signal transduction histidine kinase
MDGSRRGDDASRKTTPVAARRVIAREAALAAALFGLWLAWPRIAARAWYGVIVIAREAIRSGDSGMLLVASTYGSAQLALAATALYLALALGGDAASRALAQGSPSYRAIRAALGPAGPALGRLGLAALCWLGLAAQSVLSVQPWEPLPAALALAACLILNSWAGKGAMATRALVTVQTFFALHWLAFMPGLDRWGLGMSDPAASVKLSAEYLGRAGALDILGFSFGLALAASAGLSSLLFRALAKSSAMEEESRRRAAELEAMKAKVLQNRLYLEINALAHDLKTPLVTISGLNSLLELSMDTSKLGAYCARVRGAVDRMNETITSFLYGGSRQVVTARELFDYVRAQVPIEDPEVEFRAELDNDLPPLKINRVRIARALVNVIENAITAPSPRSKKRILMSGRKDGVGALITIADDGAGIPERELADIWTLGHSSKGSSGLGLPLARQIVEENEGRIWLESEYGSGTRVSIWLRGDAAEVDDGR